MLDLRKFLQREPEESPVTEVEPSGHSTDEIAREYRAIILDQLARGGVLPKCVEVEVRQAGKLRDGVQHLKAMPKRHTQVLKMLLGQVGENALIDVVFRKALRILGHAE